MKPRDMVWLAAAALGVQVEGMAGPRGIWLEEL